MFTCDIHGFLIGDQIRIVNNKGRSYEKCRECQKVKDRKHAKKYRDENKEYYAQMKREHYEEKPEMQIERNRRYRDNLRRKRKPE